MDLYGFYTGKIFDAYKYLGAHAESSGVTFRTFCTGGKGYIADCGVQQLAGAADAEGK